MTEEEAKTKWCPFSRVVGREVDSNELSSASNRYAMTDYFPLGSHCIGSSCMAWRWVYSDPNEAKTKGGILLPHSQWPGFCGLAGNPR